MATDVLKEQKCPVCLKNELVLSEVESEVPFFGRVFVFSMHCSSCHYHKADVEAAEKHAPSKFVFEVSGKHDLSVRVVRSSEGVVRIPNVGSIEPGPDAEGFITNIEGIIEKFKKQIEFLRDSSEEECDREKAKNLLKKLQNVLHGSEKLKIIIEDPSGNSAIVSEKAVRSKL